jgi:hypothetical protein
MPFGAVGRATMFSRTAMLRGTAMLTVLAECQGSSDQNQGTSQGRADFQYGRHSVSPLNCQEG